MCWFVELGFDQPGSEELWIKAILLPLSETTQSASAINSWYWSGTLKTECQDQEGETFKVQVKMTAAILETGLINSFYFKEMCICSQRVKKFTFVSSVAEKTFQWHHTEADLCERRHNHLELHVLRRCITVTCPVLVLHNTFPFTPFASRSMSFGLCHRFNQGSLIFFSMKFNLREFF